MKETSNPVVWQSRTWLMDALAALMEEKKFEEITVVEICRRADLSRRTFYRNYSSKEDLFRSCCERCAGNMSGIWNGIPPILRRISQRCPIRTGPKFTAGCKSTGKKP